MIHDQSLEAETLAPIVDPESATEMARLLNKGRMLTRHMGGLLPEQLDAARVTDVLDIGCGPGGWALDLAFAYPQMQVVGVDVSRISISYARMMARGQKLTNASFHVMDVLQPLEFPDQSFDLVNADFVAEFLPKMRWPDFLRECWRLLRPGGVVRLTENELGLSNSPAHEHLCALYLKALFEADRLYSPDGRHLGMVNMLVPFLSYGGFTHTGHRVYAVNYSYGADMHEEWAQDLMLKVRIVLPFLARMGIATLPELEQMADRMGEEMASPSFSALCVYLTASGVKPFPWTETGNA